MEQARKDAIVAGRARYMSDRQCPQGHGYERYASNAGCVTCVLETARFKAKELRDFMGRARGARLERKKALEHRLWAGLPVDREAARDARLKHYIAGDCDNAEPHTLPWRLVETGECIACLRKQKVDLLS